MNAAQRRKARRAAKPQPQFKLRPYQIEVAAQINTLPRNAIFTFPV